MDLSESLFSPDTSISSYSKFSNASISTISIVLCTQKGDMIENLEYIAKKYSSTESETEKIFCILLIIKLYPPKL